MAPKKDTAKKEIASKQGDLREEKMKALESALAQLNKTYGKGAVMKFGDAAADANLQVIPTPSSTRSTRWIPSTPGSWA